MEEKQSLVRAIQRLATDEELRHRLLSAPREVVMAELGISSETYHALVSLARCCCRCLFVLAGVPTRNGGH